MASSQQVELEAARLLQKLIQESKDEPAKLATKLYVICQHMKLSGKEQSLPYQVISRAMETVVSQHGIDMDALRSSRIPLAGGPQAGDSSGAMSKDKDIIGSLSPMVGSDVSQSNAHAGLWNFPSGSTDMTRHGASISGRVPAGPNRSDVAGADIHQGSMSQKSGRSSGMESPASLQIEDTRSMNSHDSLKSDEKTSKKSSSKRKRMDPKATGDMHSEDNSKSDAISTGHNIRKGKQAGKAGTQGQPSSGVEHDQSHTLQVGSAQVPPLPSGAPFFRAHPEGPSASSGRTIDKTKPSNPFAMAHISNFAEGLASGNIPTELQKSILGGANLFNPSYGWNQNPQGAVMKNTQGSPPNLMRPGVNVEGKANIGSQGTFNSTSASQMDFPTVPPYMSSSFRGGLQFPDKGKDLASGNTGTELNSSKFGAQMGIMHGSPMQERHDIVRPPQRADSSFQEGRLLLLPSRNVGSSQMSNSNISPNMPFKEQQLKQLRAQCLVFLAFRNNMQPRKVHLEIALGVGPPAEGGIAGQRGNESRMADISGKENGSSQENPAIFGRQSDVSRLQSTSAGSVADVDSASKDPEIVKKKVKIAEHEKSLVDMENIRQAVLVQGTDSEMHYQEIASPMPSGQLQYFQGDTRKIAPEIYKTDAENSNRNLGWGGGQGPSSLGGNRHHLNLEASHLAKDEASKESFAASRLHDMPVDGSNHSLSGKDQTPEIAGNDVENGSHMGEMVFEQSADEGDGNLFEHDDLPSSPPKYTTTEKWILDYRKRTYIENRRKAFEQQKAEKRISVSYMKLKENVSSSEDLSAKTKSVIELKKLQLLQLQRRVRSEFLLDFFKPNTADLDRIKSIKKHRHGRRIKQLEKIEQKMKEERQKRIRERQKEFFSDIEAHRERLEDSFKAKRERLKGFNRYVKEFHKRKERIHREKLDRIQREKINLLKNNDVEGYLRMVQDAKSDRVKQLLRETEKYLQKLGAKLQGAKSMDGRVSYVSDSAANDIEDESYQPQHYLESNEKYYQLAHSVKEVVNDQPSYLQGGKLREYQMNGLRWLVSLYNNNLNGILADEMGLGKTVQVISLLCYLMETKNDRGPFLVVVPSSVLPGWNNLEELWALLNFLLPNIFNSSEDFSQWFNKPFESNGDSSTDEALLSEEENLLIINRLHQVLRPFVLRRLKHKVFDFVFNIERLVRCEASAYQKLLMTRVEENLGGIGAVKVRSVHNSVMELRNICNHPYLSQLHVDEIEGYLPRHYLPSILRLCGKLEMLDRLLPKLKATGHRVLLFSTMTRLLDVMEDYLVWKKYKYLRLDGHTSGQERGALIDNFNNPNSQAFIFLLSIRAGGVGVNLQAADTVIIFDTDWNPQVDLQAQARAHRIGQKKEVLVLRLETVRTVEEQVRASAEHKLGVANQSITAGFFDNNTSAEDRREYLESLLRECKKEEAAPVLDDDALNDLLARSEDEIDIFESMDKQRREEERAAWLKVVQDASTSGLDPSVMPSRLVTDDDLKSFCNAMKIYESSNVKSVKVNVRRKGELGGLDTQHYGRGKRAREVRSYEDQWTEEEFEKLCQVDSPESPQPGGISRDLDISKVVKLEVPAESSKEPVQVKKEQASAVGDSPPAKRRRGRPRRSDASLSPVTAPTNTGRQDAVTTVDDSSSAPVTTVHSIAPDVAINSTAPSATSKPEIGTETKDTASVTTLPDTTIKLVICTEDMGTASVPVLEGSITKEVGMPVQSVHAPVSSVSAAPHPLAPVTSRGRKIQAGETPRRRGRKPKSIASSHTGDVVQSPVVAVCSGVAYASSAVSLYPQGNILSSHASTVAGLQKDMVTAKPAALLPEGVEDIPSSAHEGNKDEMVKTPLAENIYAGTVTTPGNANSQLPKIAHNENAGLVQVSTEQNFSASTPTIPVVSEGLLKVSEVLVADKPVEKQGARRRGKKISGSEDTGVSTRQRSASKRSGGTPSAANNAGTDTSTCEKTEIVKEIDGSSLQDTYKGLPSMVSTSHEKYGYDSQPSTPIAVPINEATLPSGFNDIHATQSEIHPAKESTNSVGCDKILDVPLEAPQSVSSQAQVQHETEKDHVEAHSEVTTAHPDTILAKSSLNPIIDHKQANAQFESHSSSLHSSGTDIVRVPCEVDSAALNKAPSRRRKGSAREPRTRSTSATAASERRARLAGSKQTDDTKKVDISGGPSTTVCVSSIKQQEDDTLKAEYSTVSAGEEQNNAVNLVCAEVSIPAGIPEARSEQPNQTASQSIGIGHNNAENRVSVDVSIPAGVSEPRLELPNQMAGRSGAACLQVHDSEQEPVSANDKDNKVHEVHPMTADHNILPSNAQGTLQDKIDSCADVDLTLCEKIASSEAESNDSATVIATDDQTLCNASDNDAPPFTEADRNGQQSECVPADLIGYNQDNKRVEDMQTDDVSLSSSHLPAALQSTEPNQPAEQGESLEINDSKFACETEQETEETMDKSDGDNLLIETHDNSHIEKSSPAEKNENLSTQVTDVGEVGTKTTTVETLSTMSSDGLEDYHSALSTHGSSTNDISAPCEGHKDPENHLFGELSMPIGSSELKSKSLDHLKSTCQSGEVNVKDTNASLNVQIPSLTELEEKKSPGGTEIHISEQEMMVSAAEPSSAKDSEDHNIHEVHHNTVNDSISLPSVDQNKLQDHIDTNTDVDVPSCQRNEVLEGEKDHSADITLAGCQSPDASGKDKPAPCNLSDKDTEAQTEGDQDCLQNKDTVIHVVGATHETMDLDAIQIDDISKGSSHGLPAALQSTDSNRLAEEEQSLEINGSNFSCAMEQEKMEETLNKAVTDNPTCSQVNDDSNNMDLHSYSSSEDKNVDSSSLAVDGGDFLVSKGTTVESVAAINTDVSDEIVSVSFAHADKEVSMVEVGASTNDTAFPCELSKDFESYVSGDGSMPVGLSELRLEPLNQSKSARQSVPANAEETNASLNIETLSFCEAENKSSGRDVHELNERLEPTAPKMCCTIPTLSANDKSDEFQSQEQVKMISAAEATSTEGHDISEVHHKVDCTMLSSVEDQDALQDKIDGNTDFGTSTCQRNVGFDCEKDHSAEINLTGSQAPCCSLDKDIPAPTENDHHDQKSGDTMIDVIGAGQSTIEIKAMHIEGIYKSSSSDCPAALPSTDSNQPAEQERFMNSATKFASTKKQEKTDEPSDRSGDENPAHSFTNDDSHDKNVAGCFPSKNSNEDNSAHVADGGDLVGSKDAIATHAGVSKELNGSNSLASSSSHVVQDMTSVSKMESAQADGSEEIHNDCPDETIYSAEIKQVVGIQIVENVSIASAPAITMKLDNETEAEGTASLTVLEGSIARKVGTPVQSGQALVSSATPLSSAPFPSESHVCTDVSFPVDTSETKLESAKVLEVGNGTDDGNILPSSVAEGTLQDKVGSSTDVDSQRTTGSFEAERNDSTVLTVAASQTPYDPLDKGTAEDDGNGLQSEGTTVDVTGSKEDNMEVEEEQIYDVCRSSSTHFPAALQSAEPNQPAEHADPTEDGGNGLQSEGSTVDVVDSKEDNMEVEEKHNDDISGSSSSHLPSALQSPGSDQPAERAAPAEDGGNGLQTEGTAIDVADSKEDNMEVEEKHNDDFSGSSSSQLPCALQSPGSDQLAEYAAPTEDGGNGLEIEGTAVDAADSKEHNMEVEEKQINDVSRSSSSHFPAALQSAEPNQPAEHAGPAEDDGNGLQSEGTAVDVADSKDDNMEVEEKQIDDISGSSSSHLPSALQSTESDHPADHARPTEVDGNGLQSEGPAIDMTCSRQDNIEVEEVQIDDMSRDSSSLPAALESTESTQPAEQFCLQNSSVVDAKFACLKELEKMDETLDKSGDDNSTCLQTGDDSHDMASGMHSPLEDKNEDSSVQVPKGSDLLVSKETTVEDLGGCEECHTGLSTHSNEVALVKIGTAGCEVHGDPESHLSGEVSVPAVSSELTVELTNQSKSTSQSGAAIIEESNVSLNIQITALAESEDIELPGGVAHDCQDTHEVDHETVHCTISAPIGNQDNLQDNIDDKTDVSLSARPAHSDFVSGNDHSTETNLADSQAPSDASDKDTRPTEDDSSDQQGEDTSTDVIGPKQAIPEVEAMQIDGIYEGPSNDLPAVLQSTISNQPAEQERFESNDSKLASTMDETSDVSAGDNPKCSLTNDNSQTINLVGYSPSEDSNDDDYVQAADGDDVMGNEEATVDVLSAACTDGVKEHSCSTSSTVMHDTVSMLKTESMDPRDSDETIHSATPLAASKQESGTEVECDDAFPVSERCISKEVGTTSQSGDDLVATAAPCPTAPLYDATDASADVQIPAGISEAKLEPHNQAMCQSGAATLVESGHCAPAGSVMQGNEVDRWEQETKVASAAEPASVNDDEHEVQELQHTTADDSVLPSSGTQDDDKIDSSIDDSEK
ncbi:hypothetical protein ABZP36_010986 [Zizania latifolia]